LSVERVLVLVIESSKIADADKREHENGWEKKTAPRLQPDAEPIRVARFVFIFPSRPHGVALKEDGVQFAAV
jgi:hypothetical protein